MRIAFVLIVALLCLTTVLPHDEAKSPGGNGAATLTNGNSKAGATPTDSAGQPFYYSSYALLRLSAGKRWGYTQHEMDSIQNIISIRKKF